MYSLYMQMSCNLQRSLWRENIFISWKKTFVNKIYKAAVMIVVMEINWLYCHLIPTPHKKKLH